MKIIRHFHKMFVYSFSLLLSAQQISCMEMQQLSPAPAAHPDQKSINQLCSMLDQHNNVDDLIDTMQKALGGIDDENGSNLTFFMIAEPTPNDASPKTKSISHTDLALLLCAIQEQRQKYDAAIFFNLTEYIEKRYNKQLVRNNFIPSTTFAYSKRCTDFNPDTSIINDIPKSAQAIKSLALIKYLQGAFATIDTTKQCLSTPVTAIIMHVSRMFSFFDNPPCCLSLFGRNRKKLEHNVFLRTHIIPYCYFIERQKRIQNPTTIPQSLPTSTEQPDQNQPPQNQQSSKTSMQNNYPPQQSFGNNQFASGAGIMYVPITMPNTPNNNHY